MTRGAALNLNQKSLTGGGDWAVLCGTNRRRARSIPAVYLGDVNGEEWPERVLQPCHVVSENVGEAYPFALRFADGFRIIAERRGWGRRA